MATLIHDSPLQQRLIAERVAAGADYHDEVWQGGYFTAPLADNEHQRLVGRLTRALQEGIEDPGLGQVLPGVNLCPVGWPPPFDSHRGGG